MWRGVRCTHKRLAGRPAILRRTRWARRRRFSILLAMMFSPLLLLCFLLHYDLVYITHALAFVRLRRAEVAYLRGHLTDKVFVRPAHGDAGLVRTLDRDAVRNVVRQ